uniref:Uncharacterized protein n=1 Tax=Solanum lycopersicum TaxID=4081 RepID=A0A3Q7EF54_SOLLC
MPLHLVKGFEEKRIARKSSKITIGKHRETKRIMKKPLKEKLIVGFYRSGGCCEEILVPVKIASNDREIKNTKNIAIFPTLRIGGRVYVHPPADHRAKSKHA